MKVFNVKPAHFSSCQEWYGDLYKCPSCSTKEDEKYVMYEFDFCQNCGVKLNWDEVDEFEERKKENDKIVPLFAGKAGEYAMLDYTGVSCRHVKVLEFNEDEEEAVVCDFQDVNDKFKVNKNRLSDSFFTG